MNIENILSQELNIDSLRIKNCLQLIEQGFSIPFISRYRKEMTKSMTEVEIESLFKLNQKYQELEKRKIYIIEKIKEQKKLTSEIKSKIENCWDPNLLEDIYLPFKKKTKTKAEIAIGKGLEKLANAIMVQSTDLKSTFLASFINSEVESIEEALEGAKHIIAERINENGQYREIVREDLNKFGILKTKVVKSKESEAEKYQDYFEYSQLATKCPSHRILAILRAEKQGYIRVKTESDADITINKISRKQLKNNTSKSHIEEAIEDAYKRLIHPSIENEVKKGLKEKADDASIEIFTNNLKQLLLFPPLGQKAVLAIDPGYRTGCKIVCLNSNGDLLCNDLIYVLDSGNNLTNAKAKLSRLVEQYKIEAIAIGNGTASKETEKLVRETYFKNKVEIHVVSESGASIYSASAVGREEFPDYDVTVRGCVSIGRRLQDPLAELVKLDPKTIGVGQYQYDVNQTKLKDSLNRVVEFCVNDIGVNLNTASEHLLKHISGIGPQLAKNIVSYRKENGDFKSRAELKKVPKLGPKAYTMSAGFLRIKNGKNILDDTNIHPDAYSIVKEIAKDLKLKVEELIGNRALLEKLDLEKYKTNNIGIPTLTDIKKELLKPTQDSREELKSFSFNKNINSIEDLREGMRIPGIVTNLTNFGAFVDIGIKENGLLHISQICDDFISDPSEKLKLNQTLNVKILSVDLARKRIQLTLK